jgi:hypothetical protein
MLDANTIVAGDVRVCSRHPVRSLCERLVKDGYSSLSALQIWRGTEPYLLVFSIGAPDQHVKLKAKRSDDRAF